MPENDNDPIYPRALWRLPERYGMEPKGMDYVVILSSGVFVIIFLLTGAGVFKALGTTFLFGMAAVSAVTKLNEEDARLFSSHAWARAHRNKRIIAMRMSKQYIKKLKKVV